MPAIPVNQSCDDDAYAWEAFDASTQHLKEQNMELDRLARLLRDKMNIDELAGAEGELSQSPNAPASARDEAKPHGCACGPPTSPKGAQWMHACLSQALSEAGVTPGKPEFAGPTARAAVLQRMREFIRYGLAYDDASLVPQLSDKGSTGEQYVEAMALVWQLLGDDTDAEEESSVSLAKWGGG